MLSRNIKFKGFQKKKIKKNLKELFQNLINKSDKKNNLINSFSKTYKFSFNKNLIKKYKKFQFYHIYGMGGSSLGGKAIYEFIGSKNKKFFFFFNNIDIKNKLVKTKKKNLKYYYFKIRQHA